MAKRLKEVQGASPEMVALLSKIRTSGRPVSVCFFNNKGGVGKTTLVANLAAQLALVEGAKVLVVDADPQCNLTQYVLDDEKFNAIYTAESADDTIHKVVHPLAQGKGFGGKLPITKVPAFGFDLVAGDPRLALKEDLLAADWRDAKAGGTRGLRTTFLFSDLLEKAATYDFVFFDMGPSLGAINRSILMAASHFLVPMSIDIFSLWAVRNIATALGVWTKELQMGIRMAEDPDEVAALPKPDALKFIGYATQQHKERTEDGNPRVVQAYQEIREKIPEEILLRLTPWFAAKDMQPNLGEVKHLASLAPKSQTLHSPMIAVSVVGSYTKMRKQAQQLYGDLAVAFAKNVSAGLK